MVIDLRLAYITDGANGCSLRVDRPVAGGSLSGNAVNYVMDFNGLAVNGQLTANFGLDADHWSHCAIN